MVREIVFLISFLDITLPVYKNKINSCVFNLHPTNVLNLFTSSNSVLGDFCASSIDRIMSGEKQFYIFFSNLNGISLLWA